MAAGRHRIHSAAKPQPNFYHEGHEVLNERLWLVFLRELRGEKVVSEKRGFELL
jgi:hypothetical protein